MRQCVFAAAAAVIMLGASMLTPKGIRRAAFFVWIGGHRCDDGAAVHRPHRQGRDALDRARAFTLQPSEFMKPALIVLVVLDVRRGAEGAGACPASPSPSCSTAWPSALLLIQPDVGQTVLITVAFGAAFFMAGVPFGWIGMLGGVAVAGLVSTYFLFDHVASRVNRFLSPGEGRHPPDRPRRRGHRRRRPVRPRARRRA